MDYAGLEKKYKMLGVENYQFNDVVDVAKVLHIFPFAIEGYDSLTKDLQIKFEKFLVSYYNGFGLEYRERIKFVNVKEADDELILVANYVLIDDDNIDLEQGGLCRVNIIDYNRYY